MQAAPGRCTQVGTAARGRGEGPAGAPLARHAHLAVTAAPARAPGQEPAGQPLSQRAHRAADLVRHILHTRHTHAFHACARAREKVVGGQLQAPGGERAARGPARAGAEHCWQLASPPPASVPAATSAAEPQTARIEPQKKARPGVMAGTTLCEGGDGHGWVGGSVGGWGLGVGGRGLGGRGGQRSRAGTGSGVARQERHYGARSGEGGVGGTESHESALDAKQRGRLHRRCSNLGHARLRGHRAEKARQPQQFFGSKQEGPEALESFLGCSPGRKCSGPPLRERPSSQRPHCTCLLSRRDVGGRGCQAGALTKAEHRALAARIPPEGKGG